MITPAPDNRVTENGRPVTELRLVRGWFIIRRADGPAGVVLITRIPGYLSETSPHGSQAGAEREQRAIYDAYCDSVRALTENEET